MTTTTHVATLELDPRSHQWMADFEDLPVPTWGRSLARVKRQALEALALHLDVPLDEPAGRVQYQGVVNRHGSPSSSSPTLSRDGEVVDWGFALAIAGT